MPGSAIHLLTMGVLFWWREGLNRPSHSGSLTPHRAFPSSLQQGSIFPFLQEAESTPGREREWEGGREVGREGKKERKTEAERERETRATGTKGAEQAQAFC